MAACKCTYSFGNTGIAGAVSIQGVTKKILLVPTYKADGTKNYYDPSIPLTPAILAAKINNSDINQRWYPFGELKNVASERGDSTTESFADGSLIHIQDGVRSFTGLKLNGTPFEKRNLDKWKCQSFGVYVVDISGALVGQLLSDGYLYPLEVDNESLDVKLMLGTDTTVQKIELKYNYASSVYDGEIGLISCASITANLLGAVGLIDVKSTISNKSTTGFRAALSTGQGDVASPIMVTGLLIGDFALYNVTDSASIIITSVLEISTGVYTFVIPTTANTKVLRLTPSKTRFDFAPVVANNFTLA